MSQETVTMMILNVDLKCPCCYKKVRKLLCKFPQIRAQVFDVDKNRVMITVVCCDPERLRDKLCCKGGKTIQSIEILKPQPQPETTVKQKPPQPDTTVKQKPPQPETTVKQKPPQPDTTVKQKPPQPETTVKQPVSVCCQECYEGRGGGPCHYGYGRPVPPPPAPCYNGYGYGYGYGYGHRPPCYVSRCDYFSEENPQGCSIM